MEFYHNFHSRAYNKRNVSLHIHVSLAADDKPVALLHADTVHRPLAVRHDNCGTFLRKRDTRSAENPPRIFASGMRRPDGVNRSATTMRSLGS